MKILTGNLRGQTITFRPVRRLRPTADKTRKAIFDMLQGELVGKRILDLFSGTGALGIEALSSGADYVTFVELDRSQALSIEKSLSGLRQINRTKIIMGDSLKIVAELSEAGKKFNLVFLDPTYDKGLGEK